MSMTKCWECKAEVSSRAKACPHCGARKPGDMKAQIVLGDIARAFLALGLILMAGNCLVGSCALL